MHKAHESSMLVSIANTNTAKLLKNLDCSPDSRCSVVAVFCAKPDSMRFLLQWGQDYVYIDFASLAFGQM